MSQIDLALDVIRKKVLFHNSVDVGYLHVKKKTLIGIILKIIKNLYHIY